MTATETAFKDIAVASAQPTKQQPYKKYFLIEYTLSEPPLRAWEAHFQHAFAAAHIQKRRINRRRQDLGDPRR